MNKIDVIYKNLNFKGGEYHRDIAENLDVPIFASDVKLADLLKKASIHKYESKHNITSKNASSTKVINHFSKHPRYITDDSIVSFDSQSEFVGKRSKVESVVNKVTFRRHIKCETTASIMENLSPYKIINIETNNNVNKNNKSDPKIKLKDLDKSQKKPQKKNDNFREDFLGVKLNSYLVKICSWMQEIRTVIQSGICPVEGAEDYGRRQRRTIEFSSRFARNYSYQLGRQLMELHRTTSRSRTGAPPPGRIITTAFQTILQALQAYCNHIPTTIAVCIRDFTTSAISSVHTKFSELLRDTCELCRIIRKIGLPLVKLSTIEEMESHSKLLIQLIQDTLMSPPEPEPKQSKTTKISIINKTDKKHGFDIPFQKRHPLEARLSMYSMACKKNPKAIPLWKRNAANHAKQKLNSELTHKAKPEVRRSKAELPPPTPILPKTRFQAIKQKPLNSPLEKPKVNNDNILTMVEVERSRNCSNRLEPLLQLLVKEVSSGTEESFLKRAVRDDILAKLKGILDQVQHPPEDAVQIVPIKKEKPPKTHITVTGPKNAKLICIKDKSMFEAKTEVKPQINQPESQDQKITKSLSVFPNKRKPTKKTKNIATLSRNSTVNIIRYKFKFNNYTKPKMLYKRSLHVQPWILTSRISDKIIKNILLEIVKEINLNHLADRVYFSEFESH